MSDVFIFGPAPHRVPVDAALVQALVARQFPHWADLPVRPVDRGGWDNWTFRLGSELSVRLPSAAEYALAVEKEHRWLPRLSPLLPLPIATSVAIGAPDADYPFAWSVRRWIDGDPMTTHRPTDPVRFALDLADFLAALQRVDPADGPTPGTHNWFRGGSLRSFAPFVDDALHALVGEVDAVAVRAAWAGAVAARWDGTPRWFHGDVAAGNLLLRDGHLAAVIDFGTCGVGDPACDLAGAWTLLDDDGRQRFRDRLRVDDAMWARGRGWALWKALSTWANGAADADEDEVTAARRVVADVLEDTVRRAPSR